MRDENQLHAAVVEIFAHEDAEVKYSTVQNWYPGDAEGKGGIFNFVTKRALCSGDRSKVSWTQVETGSAITWKYPSCILKGDGSVGEFYSVALTNNRQQADTGTKMIHIGANTRSTIVSKGISAGRSNNTYRGLVRVLPRAENVRNFTQCDSLLLGSDCGAHTVPYIEVKNPTATIEHEATTSKISEDQLFYAMSRGLDAESGGRADRQRLRPRGAEAAADGVRGRGAEAAGDSAWRGAWDDSGHDVQSLRTRCIVRQALRLAALFDRLCESRLSSGTICGDEATDLVELGRHEHSMSTTGDAAAATVWRPTRSRSQSITFHAKHRTSRALKLLDRESLSDA